MGRREKVRKPTSKSNSGEQDDIVELDPTPNHTDPSFCTDDDDDAEANEDLSLKIVEKAMSRASYAASDGDGDVAGTVSVAAGEDVVAVKKVVKKKVKKVKKRKVKKVESDVQVVETVMKEEDIVVNKQGEVQIIETDGADNANSDNAVLRKLLRGPRYFDPPDKSWGACFNCGEEGHTAANCKVAKRKRPCFICGSLEHEVKQCQKGQDCFICKGGGHRAKDCPNRFKRCSQNSELCLKCGAAGHAMYSCTNNYSPDDLKEIQCYVCKRFGHLCCADYSDALPSEASCYKCGLSGHNGQECRGSRGETSAATPSLCYKCGEGGHFARECTNSAKAKKRTRDLSTPTGKRSKENKPKKGNKSAPHDLGKGHKKKKLQFENNSPHWLGKSKQRGGWITDDPGDFSRNNAWRSPATPNKKHKIFTLNDAGQGSPSYSSSKKSKYSSGTSSSQGAYANSYQHNYHQQSSQAGYANSYQHNYHQQSSQGGYANSYQHNSYQHGYSASRFGYSNGDRTRRNYDWW